MAEAKNERRLLAVACKAVVGWRHWSFHLAWLPGLLESYRVYLY